MNSAALASSIFLVCRKRKVDAGVGIAGEVQSDISNSVRQRLDDFWQAGLRGADFFISAIGPATAAFSRYDRVMTLKGENVTVSTLLEWVQQTVADYALRRVFMSGDQGSGVGGSESGVSPNPQNPTPDTGLGVVDDQTRFYVLWRWTYDGQASIVGSTGGEEEQAATKQQPASSEDASDDEEEASSGNGKVDTKKIPFGDAHLMATALGSDVNALIHRYRILDGSSTVRLLTASERDDLVADMGEPRADGSRPPLIDILHRCQLLWAAGQQDHLTEYLDDLSPTDREALRRIAQALVDLLPRGDLEKQRLEGFLYSSAAYERGESSSRGSRSPVQRGLGAEFGQEDETIRKQKRRRT
jgi:hypothetical protein